MRQIKNKSICPSALFSFSFLVLNLVLTMTSFVFALPSQSKNEKSLISKSGSGHYEATSQYTIDWTFDSLGFVTFTLTTIGISGFCAVGISSSGMSEMRGADMAFVRFENGQCTLTDCYGTGFVPPSTDSQNDLILKSCDYSDGVKTVIFSRPLDTGDSNPGQDVVLEPGTTKTCIWSYGEREGATSHAPYTRGPFRMEIPSS